MEAIIAAMKQEIKMAELKQFIARLRPEVIAAMKDLKAKTRVPMSIHTEQFIIDGLKKYGIRVEDYEGRNGRE